MKIEQSNDPGLTEVKNWIAANLTNPPTSNNKNYGRQKYRKQLRRFIIKDEVF